MNELLPQQSFNTSGVAKNIADCEQDPVQVGIVQAADVEHFSIMLIGRTEIPLRVEIEIKAENRVTNADTANVL